MKKKFIFLNPMSRNGTSLIYQLLYNHEEICFFPGRIQIGCSNPVGWPFIGLKEIKIEDFYQQLIEKTTIPFNVSKNTEWHNIKINYLSNVKIKELAELKNNFLENAKKICSIVTANNFSKLFILFIETFLSTISKEDIYNFKKAKYILIFDDHIYNLGCDSFTANYPNSHFIQTIRNSKDIVSSRKNMLLWHNNFEGDPSTLTLKKEVLVAELRRTIWNFILAHLNHEKFKTNYHVLKFENLRNTDRLECMKDLVTKLKISFNDNLVLETKVSETLFANELLYADSSLKKITAGKSSKKVNSHKVSLNDKEVNTLNNFMNNFSGYFHENIKHSELLPELRIYFEDNFINIKKDKILSNWFDLYNKKEYRKLFTEYSKLNFGGSKAKYCFE